MSTMIEFVQRAENALDVIRRAQAEEEAARLAEEARYVAEENALLQQLLRERLGVEIETENNSFEVPELELVFYAAPGGDGVQLVAQWTKDRESFGCWNVADWGDVAKLLTTLDEHRAFLRRIEVANQELEAREMQEEGHDRERQLVAAAEAQAAALKEIAESLAALFGLLDELGARVGR